MSQQLQRFVVRMLYDPGLVAAIYEGAPVPGLDEAGRRLLSAPDRRAWGTDPYRRSRSLSALLEEYPASAALAGVERRDAFFSSSAFHAAIQGRGSLALAFGDWLVPLVGPIATLERAIAGLRRPRPAPQPAMIVLGPDFAPMSLPAGALQLYQDLLRRLGARPAEALARGLRLDDLRARRLGPSQEHLLAERDASGNIGVGEASAALVALLRFAEAPRDLDAMYAEARAQGADPGEEAELIDGLLADRLLTRGSP